MMTAAVARDGIADITYTNPGYQAGRFPIYSLIEIPFHANNATGGAQALHEWYAPIAETEMSDVKFCIANPHDPGTFHSKNPIKVPGDIDGLNVRPAHATMARFVSSLGGGPVQVPAPEAREAIGWVVFGGLCIAAVFTLYLTPVAYLILARFSRPTIEEERRLAHEMNEASGLGAR